MFGNTSVFVHRRLSGSSRSLTSLWIFLVAIEVHVVARGAADRIERLDQRHAGGEHRRQRARPARDRRLCGSRSPKIGHLQAAAGP